MRIDNKALALLTAAVVGAGLSACQNTGENQSVEQAVPAPMSEAPDQAPRQGFTGPANPSAPLGTDDETPSGQPADQLDDLGSPMKLTPLDDTVQASPER